MDNHPSNHTGGYMTKALSAQGEEDGTLTGVQGEIHGNDLHHGPKDRWGGWELPCFKSACASSETPRSIRRRTTPEQVAKSYT